MTIERKKSLWDADALPKGADWSYAAFASDLTISAAWCKLVSAGQDRSTGSCTGGIPSESGLTQDSNVLSRDETVNPEDLVQEIG